jgi:RNA polymerase sigma factor (sigma-70 family)
VNEVTLLLNAMQHGDTLAADRLLTLVYDELRQLAARKMARESPGHTLDATALVHEAYLRLVRSGEHAPGENEAARLPGADAVGVSRAAPFSNRAHFFAAAAEAMRRILIERARRKQSAKHGGRMRRDAVAPDEIGTPGARDELELLAVHEALDTLAAKAPRKAELVKLRYFLGCTIPEAAELLGIAPATAEEDWTFAKAWLRRHLS